VYLALDVKHGRRVAIKVLDPDYASMVGPQRFAREIRIAAMLTHPHIVPLLDSGEVDGQLFYVMPYIEGESLRQRLQRETMLPVEQVLQWVGEIGQALSFAHAHGIVHRDIKPENLLIQADKMLVADFGIARAIDLAAGEDITSGQLVLGTPVYMSPEQASGSKLDGRSDLYSLACVTYEMLTGEPPFAGPSPQATTAKKLSGHYPPVRVVRPTIPSAIDHSLARALAVIPADRFRTVEEFAASLRAASRTTNLRWPLIAAAGAIGIGIATVVARPRRESIAPTRPRIAVQVFDNRTGQAKQDALGFMAADWITEGLQRTGTVDVVPTVTALAAARSMQAASDTADPVRTLARETGATLIVSGTIYQDSDTLVVQAQLANAAAGRLIGAVEPIRVGRNRPAQALKELRTRLMGLLALSLDDRVLLGEQPPTYDAYAAFSEGMNAYIRSDFGSALTSYARAYQADTTFVLPLLYASFCRVNLGQPAQADSVLRIVSRQRERLSEYDRSMLDYQRAELEGRDAEALSAVRRAAELAPLSKATYNFAVTAFEAREPFAAESALRRLPTDVGPMRGWFEYWELLTSALHAQGKHRPELAFALEARRRFPARIEAYVAEARALGAERRSSQLEALWREAGTQSRFTPSDRSWLALETGSELWAHGDSSGARAWFERTLAFDRSGVTTEGRWNMAQAAARLGRREQAENLGASVVAEDSTRRVAYQGLLGVVVEGAGQLDRARSLVDQLAGDERPYDFGVPQFEAGRVAAAAGDVEGATRLLGRALDRGYPYNLQLHRDPALIGLRRLPIMRRLDAKR
jgi:TolB-like protein